MALRAVRNSDGTTVEPGDVLTDFRGNDGVFNYATRARIAGQQTGKVVVSRREYYENVWGLTVIEVTE